MYNSITNTTSYFKHKCDLLDVVWLRVYFLIDPLNALFLTSLLQVVQQHWPLGLSSCRSRNRGPSQPVIIWNVLTETRLRLFHALMKVILPVLTWKGHLLRSAMSQFDYSKMYIYIYSISMARWHMTQVFRFWLS